MKSRTRFGIFRECLESRYRVSGQGQCPGQSLGEGLSGLVPGWSLGLGLGFVLDHGINLLI